MRIVIASLALSLCCSGIAGTSLPSDLGAALSKGDIDSLKQDLASDLKGRIRLAASAESAVGDPTLAGELAIWKLIDVYGSDTLAKVRALPDGPAFMAWLGGHPQTVEDFLSSGEQSEYNAAGLTVWKRIWAEFPESRDGALLRFAEAAGLMFAIPFNYGAGGNPVDPIQRYRFCLKSYRDGALFPYFDKAPTWELRHVVNSWATDGEMVWVRGKVAADVKSQALIGNACWMVPYRETNSKGVSVQDNAKYYNYQPVTMQLVVAVGGVCGAISGFGTETAQAFGIPAMAVGQPYHCAFIWRNGPGSWTIGFDGSGWAQSSPGARIPFGPRPTYMLLMDAAMADPKAFSLSQRLWWASGLTSYTRIETLAKAAAADPLNYPVLQAYLAAAKPATKAGEFVDLLLKVGRPLRDNPYALCDLLQDQMGGLLSSLTANGKTRELVEGILQAFADGDPAKQVGCAPRARSSFLGTVERLITNEHQDFESPVRDGQDAGKVWDKLELGSRMEWLRAIELAVKTAMKRKDLYEQPLNLYAAILAQDKTASVRGIPYLGGLARQALKAGIAPFGGDACAKLADLCDKAGDKAAAEEWRKAISR